MVGLNKPLWGIDLGGTKIEGVILESAQRPEVITRIRAATERDQGYEHILENIQKLIGLMKDDSGLVPEQIGMGTPGIIDPLSGLMKNSNTVILNDRKFRVDLEKKIGLNVVITNDANCMALAEAKMGAVPEQSPDAKVVFGVILGTGVGGGVVFDGQLWPGKMGIGGEWGHNFLDESGGPCYCGCSGCVENVISGPALQRYYQSIGGEELSLKAIYDRYKDNEVLAAKTIDRLTHFFGLAISSILNILDPDAIVLGGGVGNIPELYTDGVEKAKEFVFNDRLETQFLKPKLGDSAGVFGAAFLNVNLQA